MKTTLPTRFPFRSIGWLLVLLVSQACQWNLSTRSVERCTSPTAQISYQANLLVVTFTLTEQTGTINDVFWDFGDGQTARAVASAPVNHTYTASKEYPVNVRLTNLCADEFTASKTIAVSNVVPATVTIQNPTGITSSTALLHMTVTNNGNGVINRYGLCYSATETVPKIDLPNVTTATTGNPTVGGVYSFSVSQLLPNTLYYVRAFAFSNAGTIPAYSTDIKSFVTSVQPPIVVTVGTNSTDRTTATVLFRLDEAGSPAAARYGICYSATTQNPQVSNSPTVDVPTPAVGTQLPVLLTNLTANTTYWYSSFAVVTGTPPVYGITQQFTTTIEDLTTGLVLNVPFDNRNANDISGQGNNATLIGQPTFVSNRKATPQSALDFDGVDDYILIPDQAAQFTDAFTISCWIKPTTRALQTRMQIFMKNHFSDGENEQYSALIKPVPTGASGTKPYANFDVKQLGNCVKGDGWRNIEVSDLIAMDQWQHIVYVYNGKIMKEYYNGRLIREKTDLPQGFLDLCPGGKLKFGVQSQVAPDYFQGAMDDIRIYNRALTDAEVSALFQ